MPHPYTTKYPALSARFMTRLMTRPNIGIILEVIEKECDHLFVLEELEQLASQGAWADNHYLNFFSDCIAASGHGYTDEEIKRELFPFIYDQMNGTTWPYRDFSVPNGCTNEIGFWEKFKRGALGSDLSQHEVLKGYAFTSLDMARTAKASPNNGKKAQVLELRHAPYLNKSYYYANCPLYIRSTSGDKRGISQWILFYSNKGEPRLYSESPISEADKLSLMAIFGDPLPPIEGGNSALSMSSGIRAIAQHIQTVGGAGLSTSADYFSLLIEWVWFTGQQHPQAAQYHENPNWSWDYFRKNTLQWDQLRHQFSLLDFQHQMGLPDNNEHLQMRSYFLGMDQALADKALNILQVQPDESTVTLDLTKSFTESELEVVYSCGYAHKARYSYSSALFTQKSVNGSSSFANLISALVLNTFRACAKQKNLIIRMPSEYTLDQDEIALICYLMEMNPFVCDFINPLNNGSLEQVNQNLQHIFGRNRWLARNGYLPPLLDEFWQVAAAYWVAYLKTSPDLFADEEEVYEFKRCVNDMGIHGLIPLLNYLTHKENELKPSFSPLLRNIDTPPVFYAGCPAEDVRQYTQVLVEHIQGGHYFPFKQFQFSFVPNANKEIIGLLTALNRLDYFDKISLTNCLASVGAQASLQAFLEYAIEMSRTHNEWVCPIHIPELERPIKNQSVLKIVSLYNQLNNILIQRARAKHANALVELNEFKAVETMNQPEAEATGVGVKAVSQKKDALTAQFNKEAARTWQSANTELTLARAGGLALQMQQQQQIKQERNRSLSNEIEHGKAYEDDVPSELIDYHNIDEKLGGYYQKMCQDGLINFNKATLSGGTDLQSFFHTWVNANPDVSAHYTIQKITPYAARMLLKYHRQLSAGLNVTNLPRGFYTQRMANGELILGYKSTLGYTTDHNPLTMQLTTAIPKVERVLGNYEQFLNANNQGQAQQYLMLLAQMQPELTEEEEEDRYTEFQKSELQNLPATWQKFYNAKKAWIKNNWELFYSVARSPYRNSKNLSLFQELAERGQSRVLHPEAVIDLLLANSFESPEKAGRKQDIKAIFSRYQDLDYAKALGQIYSHYGDYGLERFCNLILTIESRLGERFTHHFFIHYLAHCATYSPLLQESALITLDEMINELGRSDAESALFQEFLAVQMQAVGWEDISLLWKGFRYFYNQIKDMGLEGEFTPDILSKLQPQNQNLFPCFDRILNSLRNIPNPVLRKEFVKNLPTLDLTEGGVPYAVCHDGFRLVAPSLRLTNFKEGAPTYTAPMQRLYRNSWKQLYTNRALASTSHIKPNDYESLQPELGIDEPSKNKLMWVLHTEWETVQELMEFVNKSSEPFIGQIARHVYHVFYERKQGSKRYPLEIFRLLTAHAVELERVLTKYPESVTFFDCVTRLKEQIKTQPEKLGRIFNLFLEQSIPLAHPHLDQGLLLTAVFGLGIEELKIFFATTQNLKQITRNELVILTQQLLSLDLNSLPADPEQCQSIWQELIRFIQIMDASPVDGSDIRKALMVHLRDHYNLVFKSSVTGDYRLVTDTDINNLGLEQIFEQHAARLKVFLKEHIAISESQDVAEQLKPIIEFFKRLQLNKTYINEVEPLLATLEKVVQDHQGDCWTASYFSEFIRALQPRDSNTGFPVSMLDALLRESQSPLKPLPIDEIQIDFDPDGRWHGTWSAILAKGETFTRMQQTKLARLSVRSMEERDFTLECIEALTSNDFDGLRDLILDRMLHTQESSRLQAMFAQCRNLLLLPHNNLSDAHWKSTCHLWIDLLTHKPEFEDLLFSKINILASPQKELILHIIAYSSFPSHDYPTVPRSDYFKGNERSKVVRLAERLAGLPEQVLRDLAACYPGKPAPDTYDLMKLTKNSSPISLELNNFLTTQHTLLRQDYRQLTSSRASDLARLLESTYVTRGKENGPISAESGIKLTLMFQYLKQIEQGHVTLGGFNKPLNALNKEELRQVFNACSHASAAQPDNAQLKTQVWAILFEVLGRTTDKYPHLAQQFALIANDELLAADPSSVLQLKTGEGKSHFIAMRAARHVGAGKQVDVCTAKWSLAERDLLDYQQFFDYLNIKTANVHARSSRETYMDAQVVYTTPGELSLFLDEQTSQGHAVTIDPAKRVGLGDEFDFLFYEGQKTQFNYARHTGISPKEMAWFYRGLNKFYDQQIKPTIAPPNRLSITPRIVQECYAFLAGKANENGRLYLESVTPMILYSWLLSTHEAATMRLGVEYTVRLESVKIGEEEFPLREIYPLTKDMQAAVGSTFSNGAHQLLAERLNSEAKEQNEAQNYHVHPESDIISSQVFSQRLKSLWKHWEGFTGTLSTSQACELHETYGTAVLRVPTNQKDLRKWPDPRFFESEAAREQQIVHEMKTRIRDKKSILLCAATDAEVKALDKVLRPHFSPEEFSNQVLFYTNESHDTPAEILRKKRNMEGDYLGQKKQGVVLCAAGFGRGDNVGVETVIVRSVYDKNDLDQKGGRTARNGEEGEVLQYYLVSEINDEFEKIIEEFKHYPALRDQIIQELQETKHPLTRAFAEDHFDSKKIAPKIKFELLLRLREFIAATDNYPSRVYHEAKAVISSEGLRLIGEALPESKDQLIKGFANYLADLEKHWMALQVLHKENAPDRIEAMHAFIRSSIEMNGQLYALFPDAGINYEPPQPAAPSFILDRPMPVPSAKDSLMSAAQGLLLKLVEFPSESSLWERVITSMAGLNQFQLEALLYVCREKTTLNFNDFQRQLEFIAEKHQIETDLRTFSKAQGKTLSSLPNANVNQELRKQLQALPSNASNLVWHYLLTPGLQNPQQHIDLAEPMIRYSSKNPEKSLSFWRNPATRDALLSLSPECFTEPVYLNADILLDIKKFLDLYLQPEDQKYVSLFRQLMRTMIHQSEQRKRLLKHDEEILSRTNKPKEVLLSQLATLAEHLNAEAHFTLLKRLVERMATEYKKSNIPIQELDNVWDALLRLGPRIIEILPLIERLLAQEGKEFALIIHEICQMDIDLTVVSQNFLHDFFYNNRQEAKQVAIGRYQQTLRLIQETFAGQISQAQKVFTLFDTFLAGSRFYNSPEKQRLLASMNTLLAYPQNEADAAILAARWRAFSDSEQLKVLEYVATIPNDAVNIMFTGLISRTAGVFNADQQAVIVGFYEHKNNLEQWITAQLLNMSAAQRIALITFLKNGDFVTIRPNVGDMVFTQEQSQQLFKVALDQYKVYIDSEFSVPPSKSQIKFRGMSNAQQGALNLVMNELQQIGLAPIPIEPAGAVISLPDEMRNQIRAYEKIKRKDNERYMLFQERLNTLVERLNSAPNVSQTYVDVLAEIRSIKHDLMMSDIAQASRQWIPRLHLSGQSRLYRMLNHLEDVVLKSWTEEARRQNKDTTGFFDSCRAQRARSVVTLKSALEQWEGHAPQLFKSACSQMRCNIQGRGDDEIVQYLKDNPKMVNNLPGTLRAIAQEILTHDVQSIQEIKEMRMDGA